MPAPDRLQQLLRQRALLQDHLAWLEREIAEASDGVMAPGSVVTPSPAPAAAPKPAHITAPVAPAKSFVGSQATQILAATATPATAPVAAESPAVEAVAEQIIEQYRSGPDTTKTDVRKGCLLYFFGAFVLLALVVVGLYFLFQRGH